MGKSSAIMYEGIAFSLTALLCWMFGAWEWWEVVGIWVLAELLFWLLTGTRVILVRLFVHGD